MAGVKLIQHQDAADAFNEGKAKNLRVVGGDTTGWYYTFQLEDPTTGKPQTYRTTTSRGRARTFSEPSTVFRHLKECFGVRRGSWQLNEAESKLHVD